MEIKEKYAAKFEKIELGEYVYLFEDINLWLDRKKIDIQLSKKQ